MREVDWNTGADPWNDGRNVSHRISIQDIQAKRAKWLPDTEIVNDEGKVIAYIPPPIKPMPMSWRERLARWLFRLGERIDPLLGITTKDDE